MEILGGHLSLALLLVGISVFILAIAILDRLNKLLAFGQWLQRRLMSESPPVAIDRRPNLALEFFRTKEKLTPLFFMPLASTAIELKRMYETVDKQFEVTLDFWRNLERREMEAFAATNPPPGKAFAASDNLKRVLNDWSLERHRANVIEKWTYLFTETYVDLLSGKITLQTAEDVLKCVDPVILRFRDHFEVGKIYHAWASNWEAGKWKKRLNHLREPESWKKAV